MVEQDEGHEREASKREKPDSVSPARPQGDVAAQSGDANARDNEQTEWEKQHSRLQLWFNGLVAFTALLGVLLAIYQIRESRLSSGENARDVAKSFRLAERSADAAERAVMAAETLAAAGSESVKRAQTASRLDQRAWVGLGAGHGLHIKVDDPAAFKIKIANSGHTPALKVVTTFATRRMARGAPFQIKYEPIEDASKSVLHPNVEHVVRVEENIPLSAAVLTAIDAGAIVLYVYGRIEYVDIFGAPHITTFCMKLKRDETPQGLSLCDTYNDAN